jgi:hypothetical protein
MSSFNPIIKVNNESVISSRSSPTLSDQDSNTINTINTSKSVQLQNYGSLINKFVIIPDNILTSNFNVLEIDDKFILRNIVCFIFKKFFEKTNYEKINMTKFKDFIKEISENYNDNVKYHNFYHATNILHTTYMLIDNCGLFEKFNEHILFSILISALVHDIGHPGNNNLYEINTCSELACRYNDLSVLEQHHCHLAFELIRKYGIFENYTNEEFTMCRKTIINCILGTDLANHRNLVESLRIIMNLIWI